MKWNWDDFWGIVLFLAAGLLAAMLAAFIVSDKSVKSYYLDTSGGNGTGTCVRSQIEWDEDRLVYCSQNIDQVLDVLNKANRSLAGAPK